ncbi:MAG: hypothetical protein LUQ28_12780 [Methylococcaceae bacterium]|nr:hypothetical protein [Methylococcaceae bacterium]
MKNGVRKSMVSEQQIRDMKHGDILLMYKSDTFMMRCTKFLNGWELAKFEMHNVRAGFFKWEYRWILISDVYIPEK